MSAGGRHRSFSTFDDAMEYDIRKLTDYLWELPKGVPLSLEPKRTGPTAPNGSELLDHNTIEAVVIT